MSTQRQLFKLFLHLKLEILQCVDIILTLCIFFVVVILLSNGQDHSLECAQYLEFAFDYIHIYQTLNIVQTPNYDLDH